MKNDVNLQKGNTNMIILKLLDDKDMYGYQIIEELARRSDDTFKLKSGTLYPLLHLMEDNGLISSYELVEVTQRPRRYYRISPKGKQFLYEKEKEWNIYSKAVNRVLQGGVPFECAR